MGENRVREGKEEALLGSASEKRREESGARRPRGIARGAGIPPDHRHRPLRPLRYDSNISLAGPRLPPPDNQTKSREVYTRLC